MFSLKRIFYYYFKFCLFFKNFLNALGEDHVVEGEDEGELGTEDVVVPGVHALDPEGELSVRVPLVVVLELGGELGLVDDDLRALLGAELRLADGVGPDVPVVVAAGSGGSHGGGGGGSGRSGAGSDSESTKHIFFVLKFLFFLIF